MPVIDKQKLLAEHIRSLADWGMLQSEIEQINWEWNESEEVFFFHNSPKKIVARIDLFLAQYDEPSISKALHNLSARV